MTGDILGGLVRANLAGGAAILLLLLIRLPAKRAFGARIAYGLWLLPPIVALASLAPFSQQNAWLAVHLAAPSLGGPSRIADGPLIPWPGLAALGWAVGALACGGVLALRQFAFVLSLGRLRPALVGGTKVLRAASAMVGPAVVGSAIVIPADFEVRFTPREQEAILAHEGAHLARWDVAVNLVAAVAQCLCWFNPLVHLAIRILRLDQELACDATVIETRPHVRRAYGEALLKSQFAPFAPPAACLWPAPAQHPLKERIVMLKRSPPTRARRRLGAALLAALAVGGGYAAWAAQPGAVIANPDWIERPSGADLVRFYPAEAARTKTPGEAVMQCRVETSGGLAGCTVLREAPEGAGFGEAALQMAPLLRMRPMTRDGTPVAGGVVRIPIAFRFAVPPSA